MQVVTTRAELATARARLRQVGLVPTMGYLHEGHLSLVRAARAQNEAVVVSIFVNPTQFGAGEDFETYPRDTERDLQLLADAGVDLVWMPQVHDVYPPGASTSVLVSGLTDVLEGAHRPGHFTGVATVVAILLNATRADRAYFGQKDAQQVLVVRRMVDDLAIPTTIVTVPTHREGDGLAMSSRNVYLDEQQRPHATVLVQALTAASRAWSGGERDADRLRAAMTHVLAAEPLAQPDYVSVADPQTLAELSTIDPARGALCSLAVRFGRTRLIDNVVLSAADQSAVDSPAEQPDGKARHT
ncbi:pantoate--beta-alanine ligase [Kineosphaera limosa]|uniref:Pantothenate synthetase n=1 Tax=Kineosphaera limosa NBRC 100340 TaxID=1184609 RepID=K6VM96_9MICO|nr:pantoate--beta-alanine ligase [Kineosphaera limosa]NYE01608.1 pantoate--beta-alanine ligase [Kineosphaera limosa]GAB97318.1 pantothenate synthetase [Kineosphaera limosa NBRC 100340]